MVALHPGVMIDPGGAQAMRVSMICIVRVTAVAAALALSLPANAQSNIDAGKTPPQTFASDCAPCHKSPQGLYKGGGSSTLAGFLREHYTASRETAGAMADYLSAMDKPGAKPAAGPRKREAKPAAKPAEEKLIELGAPKESAPAAAPASAPAEVKPAEAKPAEAKPAEAKPAEAKPAEAPAAKPTD
jgi:hypothetical protein